MCPPTSPPASRALLRGGQIVTDAGIERADVRLADGLIALLAPLAETGGVYVSHMRGGYEAGARVGIEEMAEIARATGVPLHVSHVHAEPELVLELLDELEAGGIDVSFDAYPYDRGCTLVAMLVLPPEITNLPTDEAITVLATDRDRLRTEWFPHVANQPNLGPDWPTRVRLGHVPHADYAWAQGLTLADAADRTGTDPIDVTLDLLIACRMEINAVITTAYSRGVAELGPILAHAAHQGGSDGIFIGGHPHPRARGTFARYLRDFAGESKPWSWPEAVAHLATNPATRFGLGQRGRIATDWVGDVIVVDPATVSDGRTNRDPIQLSTGIDDVFLGGQHVLAAGELTDATPGVGLRRHHIDGAR